MASMLETLVNGEGGSGGLFHHEDGTDVPATLVIDESVGKALAGGLLTADAAGVIAQLEALGVHNVEFKSAVVAQSEPSITVPVELLGGDYNEVDLQKLIEKYHS
jgi:hypothetical protein